MSVVVSELMELVRKEKNILMSFVKTPKGVFQTVDECVVAARESAKKIRERVVGGKILLR
jgi:hypothetical protein